MLAANTHPPNDLENLRFLDFLNTLCSFVQVPRICFVNKMDRLGADFYNCVRMVVSNLGAKPLCLQLPIGERDGPGIRRRQPTGEARGTWGWRVHGLRGHPAAMVGPAAAACSIG